MSDVAFMENLNNGGFVNPEDNVFKTIWGEYERVILESLVTSFGLDFLIKDQHGGDVDTIHNVRKIDSDENLFYKDKGNQLAYENRGEYDSVAYHADKAFKDLNASIKEKKINGNLKDTYTGKVFKINDKVDGDHIISAKEIHDDRGRILAGLDGKDLANCEENFAPTDRSINRSMGAKDIELYLKRIEEKRPERQARIKELSSKDKLSDKERKELKKLNKLEEIDPERMRQENAKARKEYEAKINRAYYTSPQFVKDTTVAAGKVGLKMGMRQALGFVFMEIWFCTKEELRKVAPGSGLKEMLHTVARGIKKGMESAKIKYKELLEKFKEGLAAGILSSITTTICNIFFTTAKNLVRFIRQIYASVVQAGKVLLFNPDNLMLGDRIKAATIILATGASVLVGTVVGEILSKSPVAAIPVLGSIAISFISSLVSGLLSCTLLLFLDRSAFINKVVNALNRIPSEVNNYREIADAMEALAAKLENIDLERFKKDTERYQNVANSISNSQSEEDLNNILHMAYKEFGIKLPWEGDFDTFMGNKNNRLVFE